MTPQNRRDFLFESLVDIITPLTTDGSVVLRRGNAMALQGAKPYLLPYINDDAFEELVFERERTVAPYNGQSGFAIAVGVFSNGEAEYVRRESNKYIDLVERQFIKAFTLLTNYGATQTFDVGGVKRRVVIERFTLVGNSAVKIQGEESADTVGVFGTIDYVEVIVQ